MDSEGAKGEEAALGQTPDGSGAGGSARTEPVSGGLEEALDERSTAKHRAIAEISHATPKVFRR